MSAPTSRAMSAATLRINRIHYPVSALGPGRRLGIWVQGCPLACRGCVSRDTWDPGTGQQAKIADLARLWRQAVDDGADGITVSGGEPLAQPAGLAALLVAVDSERPRVHGATGAGSPRELDILVYTGYELSELDDPQLAALRHADALITGRYDIAQPTTLIWRGSANQRIVPRTPLGRQRYVPYLDHVPERPEMQVAVADNRIWFIGVPRRGDMPRLEQRLRERGVRFGTRSWRP